MVPAAAAAAMNFFIHSQCLWLSVSLKTASAISIVSSGPPCLFLGVVRTRIASGSRTHVIILNLSLIQVYIHSGCTDSSV